MASDSRSELNCESIMCPICLDVFIEPITLMCKHELCKQCYDEHFEKADFRCPMCKKRLSSWARKAVSRGSLVNKRKWKFIQENCSELVRKRLNGEDTYNILVPNRIAIADSGEVRSEYLQMREVWDNEVKAERDKEESASLQLIEEMLQEERQEAERNRLKQIERDEELAKVISTQLNQPISPTSVGKKLLRSTTKSIKKRKAATPSRRNSIEKYCTKKTAYHEKENAMPECSNSSFEELQIHKHEKITPPAKRCKLYDSCT